MGSNCLLTLEPTGEMGFKLDCKYPNLFNHRLFHGHLDDFQFVIFIVNILVYLYLWPYSRRFLDAVCTHQKAPMFQVLIGTDKVPSKNEVQ